jgi:hypothetical protein
LYEFISALQAANEPGEMLKAEMLKAENGAEAGERRAQT